MKRALLFFLALFGAAEAKRVLVTGGAGFLGSHLCDRLIGDGCEVVCLDNFSTGKKENIEHLLSHPRFFLLQADVCDPLPETLDVDEIYHLACPASPVRYQSDPVKTVRTCVIGTLHALELAKRCGAKFFQASTSEVYGDPIGHPQKETDWGHVNPIGIRACYDEGKRCGETLCFDFHRKHGTRIKVGRIFNTYGPRMSADDGRAVSNFLVQALRGEPLTIYGNGQQTRSFCFVTDLIEGIVRFMATADECTGPMNLGNPAEMTLVQLAEEALAITGSRSPLVFKPLPQDDPKKRMPDISLAKFWLDWSPKVSIREGLQATADAFSAMRP